MSKWGLLRGLGQGVAQAGTMLAADQFDRMKEERLEKYRQSAQQKQWERDDKTRAEDRNFAEQSELRGITERAQNRVQDQANLDRDYEQRQSQFKISSDLVNKQIQQINQEIDITSMELERQRDIQAVWDQIQDTEDEQQLENLFDRYRRLTGTDKDDRYSLHTVPEYDDMGERVGTTVYTHNSRTNEVTPYSGGAQQVDRGAQLREALGLSAAGAAATNDNNQQAPSTQPWSMTNPGGGLVRPQPPASPERDFVQTQREQQRTQAAENQRSRQERAERESFDVILGRVNQGAIGDIPGRAQPNSGTVRRNIIANQEELLRIIESPVATDIQKQQARNLLQSISGR